LRDQRYTFYSHQDELLMSDDTKVGNPIIARSDGIKRDPNYPGNPDPDDPIPTWNWDMNEDEKEAYRRSFASWRKRHPEFNPY
jgi:hypothetical protein